MQHSVTFFTVFDRRLTGESPWHRPACIMYTRRLCPIKLLSIHVLVRVLAPITYRNELICSFNTFCTCIRPTSRLMSGIPLLFVREDASFLQKCSRSTRPASRHLKSRRAGTFAKHHVHFSYHFNLLVRVLAPITYRI